MNEESAYRNHKALVIAAVFGEILMLSVFFLLLIYLTSVIYSNGRVAC